MKTSSVGKLASAISIAALILLQNAEAQSEKLQIQPMNPKYVRYVQEKADRALPKSSEGYKLGYVPAPFGFDLSKPSGAVEKNSEFYDASYDLRTGGRVSSVKNQNPWGTCWSFATYASLESCLMPLSPEPDFSENNLVNKSGFDLGYDDGGNYYMSTAYLARWAGPIAESDDSYPDPGYDPSGLTTQRHIQNVAFLPARTSYTDNDVIKEFITTKGAAGCSIYWDGAYYNAGNSAFYYNGVEGTNHAVTAVGWNDNYPAANFGIAPAGNGAFLIKNSWGSAWGSSGYFWISYYDTALSNFVSFYNAQKTSSSLTVYQYDPLGYVTGLGIGTSTLYGANIFNATDSNPIQAVGTYANVANTAYEISVYTGVTAGSPKTGVLAATKSGTFTYAGFYTVALDTPVAVTQGQNFSVIVKWTTPGYNFPLPVEYASPGYSSGATASAGQSYFSSSGNSYTDITTGFDPTCNVCIKVYGAGSQFHSADFNGNGKSDVLGESHTSGWMYLMNGKDIASSDDVYTKTNSNWTVMSIADFNADGKADLLWRNSVTGDALVYLMNGLLVSSSKSICVGASSWTPIHTADFNADGKADIVWKHNASDAYALYLMDGTTVLSSTVLDCGTAWEISAVKDFNGDGKADIFWTINNSIGHICLMDGATVKSEADVCNISPSWQIIAYDDFNGDGKTDILWQNSYGNGYMHLMNGTTISSHGYVYVISPGSNWTMSKTADFNGDGKADLLWTNDAEGKSAIWLMNGMTTSSAGYPYTYTNRNWGIKGFFDFNGDGKSDILWENHSTKKTLVYLMNGASVSSSGAVYDNGDLWSLILPLD